MARMMISYCEDCRKGLPITPVKAIKKCNFCGRNRMCSMSSQPSGTVHRMAKDAKDVNEAAKRKLGIAVGE